MRLDKFLKVSRIIKRRTVADEACTAGKVALNGKIAKSGATVKVGDILEVRLGNNALKCEILAVENSVSKADASLMYRVI